MSIKVPESLKEDVPQNKWGKIMIATPVVLTVIATMLAGLSSSEMSKAQYDRSFGAQLQSKAGDQWGFFQAKRLRGALQRSTLDLMSSQQGSAHLEPEVLAQSLDALRDAKAESIKAQLGTLLSSEEGKQALRHLKENTLPASAPSLGVSDSVSDLLRTVENDEDEAKTLQLLAKIAIESLAAEVKLAQGAAKDFESRLAPVNQAVESLDSLVAQLRVHGLDAKQSSALAAARIAYNARRYEAEARANQTVARLLELQVKKANQSAERHHRRSQRFFYVMLAAQFGAIVATLGIATQKRNLLWGLAACAGTASLLFAAYVYLYV